MLSGTKWPAKFTATMFDVRDRSITMDEPIDSETLPQIFSLGQPKNSSEMLYSYKFSKVLPLAVEAYNEAVGGSLDCGSISDNLGFLDDLMDKFPLSLTMNADLLDEDLKYFAVQGTTEDNALGVTFLVNRQKVNGEQKTGVLAAVVLDTSVFGDLIDEVIGFNPFETVAILSNIQVSAYVSTSDFELPDPVTLPAPFEATRQIKSGFCFDGRLGRPTKTCSDPVCEYVTGVMDDGFQLTLAGCIGDGSVDLLIGVSNIIISDTVTLRTAGLTYTSDASDQSMSFGAMAVLDVVMEDVVTFKGSLYLKQKAALTLLGLSFSCSGMIPNAFGIEDLNMYDLVLAAEVGFAAGAAPVLNSLTIGGGICFGDSTKCLAMVSGSSDAELIALGTSEPSNYHERHAHLTMLQERAKSNGVIAAKLYAGFDTSSGMVFFYAAITAVTMADIASAFVGSDNLPGWMSELGIEAYDQAACDAAGGN